MSNHTLSVSKTTVLAPLLGALARTVVLAQLGKLRHGHLRLLCHGQQWSFGEASSPLQAEVEVLDDATWSLIAGNGSIGAGEAYIHGYWRSPDLARVTRLFVANPTCWTHSKGACAVRATCPAATAPIEP